MPIPRPKEALAVRATELLAQQHREVEQLFAQLERGEGGRRVRLLGELAENLTLHAVLEERFLYPLARECGLEQLVNEALEEHQDVKRRVSELLQSGQRDPRIDERIAALRQRVSAHVAEEEREVLPQLEARVEAARLETLGAEMERAAQALREQELLELAESQASASP
jgi:hemerythrin superfamily protein